MGYNIPVQLDSKGDLAITYRNPAVEGFVRQNGQWTLCFSGPAYKSESYTGENLVRFRRYCEDNIRDIADSCNVYGLDNVLMAAYESGVSDGSRSLIETIMKQYPTLPLDDRIQEGIIDDYIDASYASSSPVKLLSDSKPDPRLIADEAYKNQRLKRR